MNLTKDQRNPLAARMSDPGYDLRMARAVIAARRKARRRSGVLALSLLALLTFGSYAGLRVFESERESRMADLISLSVSPAGLEWAD